MTLAEQLFFMMQQNQKAMQLTDLETGTVTAVSPLEITPDSSMAPLRREVLYLTEPVVEKKLPVLEHFHTTSDLTHSSTALGDVAAVENGSPLPVEGGYIILNRGLAVGDKVLLLRVQHGQRFVVLSRVFD